jgi:hypothetical protein
MSAYLCEDKTINRVISFMDTDRDSTWAKDQLGKTGFSVTRPQELGKAMYDLNCRSLQARYGENAPAEFGADDSYKYEYELCSRMQAFKSLRCFLYQSCEGDVENEPLYQVLDKIADCWAGMIVSRLPEYDRLDWG